MKIKLFFIAFLSFVCTNRALHAQDLYTILSYTYESNPSIISQRTYLKALDEEIALAISGWRPTISAQGSVYVADINESNTTPYSGAISANQNIFQGFNTTASIKSAEHKIKSGVYNLSTVEQTVLTQAATAYVDVLRDQAMLELQIKNEEVLTRDLENNRNRFEVGEITKADLSQSVAQLAGAKASKIAAEGNLESSRANYLSIIGKMPEDLEAPQPFDMLMPQSLEEAKEITLSSNPQILSSKYLQRSLNDKIMVEKSALLPSLDLQASATKVWNGGEYEIDSEELKAGAVLTIPIYDAGANRASIRNAKQLSNQAKINIIKTEREIINTLTANWEMLKSSKAQIISIQAQIKASELALDGVKQEFLVGTRTVLDVLNAEQALLDARVALVEALHAETVSSFAVLSNLGRMTPTYLGLNITPYNPMDNYNDTKYKWLSIGID